MKKLLLLSLFAICSCATEAKYIQSLQKYYGAPEEQIIMNWGIPDKTYDLNGKKYLSYVNSYVYTSPTNVSYDKHWGTTVTGGDTQYYNCETTFILEKGQVIDWTFRGNNCVSY